MGSEVNRLPDFDHIPHCRQCLQLVDDVLYIPTDEQACNEGCIEVDGIRMLGDPPPDWGHLHWHCRCGFRWGTRTAFQTDIRRLEASARREHE